MAVTYITSLKNSRLDAVRDAIDTGAGANGTLEIGDSGFSTVLAVIPLADPSAPNAASGVLTFTMPQSDSSADATGTAAEARVKDKDGNVVISGLTVGTSGSDVNLDNTSINAGQTVTINSATITHG